MLQKPLVAAALVVGAAVSATAEPLDPAGAIALATAGHPRIAAADSAVAASEAERATARSGYRPRLTLSEDWYRSTDPVFVFAGKLGQEVFGPADFDVATLNQPDPFTNALTRVSLEQSIWDGDRTHVGSKAAGLAVEATGVDRDRERDRVAFEALAAFWNAVLADAMLGVAEDGEKTASAHLELATALVDEGIAIPSDRMSAEVRLAEVRAQRIRARAGARVARAALARALGVDPGRTFELDAPAVRATARAEDDDALVVEALAARAEVRSLDLRIEQARLGEKLARSGRYPTIGVGARYDWNGEQPLDATGDNWSVGLSIRVPLYEGSETKARSARVRAERERAEHIRRALEDGIRVEVLQASAERQAAIERLAVAEAALARSGEALRIVRERYGEGMAVIVELIGAETADTQARANEVEARRDVALADAALDLAVGRPIRATGE